MDSPSIIAHVDKTVLKIKGLNIMGLKPYEVEGVLTQRFNRTVRVIGVTGESLEMDVYGMDPELILTDEVGVIKAISVVEGIQASEVTKICKAEKIVEVNIDHLPQYKKGGCAKERWLPLNE